MLIGVPRELDPRERRTPVTPESIRKLSELGIDTIVEKDVGSAICLADKTYEEGGARIAGSRESLLSDSDVILRLNKPVIEELQFLKRGCIHISFLDPFNERKLVEAMA